MFKRTFITLYAAVTLSIVLAGWGLDRLYANAGDQNPLTDLEEAFIAQLSHGAQALPQGQRKAWLERQLQTLGLDGRVYQRDDLADSAMAQQVFAGESLWLDEQNRRELYTLVPNTSLLLRIELPQSSQGRWYGVYLALFYLFLALVIYLWVWPLVRDLRSLQAQAQQFGRAGAAGKRIRLSGRSPVYQLSLEFNRMQSRIDELLASYKEMTYAVSHELRTPLARMKFALEIAQDSQDAQTVARQLSNVRDDVNDMDALINQLLGYAGFEAQSQQLVLQAEPAGALIDMAREMSERLRQRHPQINFTFANTLAEQPLYCEWHLMERVLQNLLGNAVRYAERQVWVQLSATESGYCLVVEDDGPGIAPADRARVFDSFTRLKQLPGKDTKGFGLGLAIVNRIIGWHNGEVLACEPRQLTGARFECRWPAPVETKP